MDFPTVLVVDFGAQYAQLIARRIREAGVYSEIVPSDVPAEEIVARKPAAIVLSGGPSSVYAPGAPQIDPTLFEAGVPAFGICYGFQAMAQSLGGTVAHTGDREYGGTPLTVTTGGRYVHVIANGRIETSGAIARALACGADAVQVGEPLRAAREAPGGGVWWDSVAAHPRLPRGGTSAPVAAAGSLEQVLLGPAETADGRTNLFGALRRTMAKTGYRDLKEFQRVDLVIGGRPD